MMKLKAIYLAMAAGIVPAAMAMAQEEELIWALKPTVEVGLWNHLQGSSALPGLSPKSDYVDFGGGVDFGWTFWKKDRNSLEANVGIGYSHTYLSGRVPGMEYHYDAPAEADMDADTYIRYYDVTELYQKIQTKRMTLPIYVNYTYRVSDRVGLHALVGVKLGFNFGATVDKLIGSGYSYGVYPQYDDLLIDASYLNDFGEMEYSSRDASRPQVNAMTTSLMGGVGAEVALSELVALDFTLKYEGALNDLYKGVSVPSEGFDAATAPVTYTVAQGTRIKPLTSYLRSSKLSRLTLGVSLVYWF